MWTDKLVPPVVVRGEVRFDLLSTAQNREDAQMWKNTKRQREAAKFTHLRRVLRGASVQIKQQRNAGWAGLHTDTTEHELQAALRAFDTRIVRAYEIAYDVELKDWPFPD